MHLDLLKRMYIIQNFELTNAEANLLPRKDSQDKIHKKFKQK